MIAGQPATLSIVSGLKSNPSRSEFEGRYKERLPEFRDVAGLIRKYDCYDGWMRRRREWN